MKKLFFLTLLISVFSYTYTQLRFPTDDPSGKVAFKKTSTVILPRSEMYKRTKNWLLYQYATSKFEDYFNISKKGKPVYLAEDARMRSISGKYGFYVMYPVEDLSGLNMEQTFVMYTLTVNFKDSAFESKVSDLKCFTTNTSRNGMRPPQFDLETYNSVQLNRLDHVQQYIIPQVMNSVRKIHEDLYRNIRYGNLTSE
ncbi:MAG: hypothetical protein HYI21_13320 [Sediminibacterium sp. Gen4]|jgi:hypothetical protein|uniref:hypothetical protein n=1 Tax=unclassified Sediminibacterium TaxID=2635961 RepID=UPI0015BDD13E|nr:MULTISPECIES: hypothetical protein [unclassified Sediminibacterium]MBW0160949.1 hypothetical protein [Sediminibacterium sp.]MBW0163345.1 hypothetical protein [Sediminibacterium sp.]NWK67006.1 hypothetical protein [Sediminibacterium sp. Gen4]